MLLYGKHINTLLRTQYDDRKSDGTHDKNALENVITFCKIVIYHPLNLYVRYVKGGRRQQQPSAFSRFSVLSKAGLGYGAPLAQVFRLVPPYISCFQLRQKQLNLQISNSTKAQVRRLASVEVFSYRKNTTFPIPPLKGAGGCEVVGRMSGHHGFIPNPIRVNISPPSLPLPRHCEIPKKNFVFQTC